jgi:hypothetical protein
LGQAQAHASSASPVEQDLIVALASRYSEYFTQERRPLDEAYASAMRGVWQKHPEDADVCSLYAESLMDLQPWDFWTLDGKPKGNAEEILAVLEGTLQLNPQHPGANHLYIHAVEAGPVRLRLDDDIVEGVANHIEIVRVATADEPGKIRSLPYEIRARHIALEHREAILNRTREIVSTNLRILDPAEAQRAAGLDGTQALVIVSFESAELSQRDNIVQAVELARACGGVIDDDDVIVADGGGPTGRGGAVGAWRDAFIGVGNGVETSLGLVADTFETAITWDRWPEFDAVVRDRVGAALREVFGSTAELSFCSSWPLRRLMPETRWPPSVMPSWTVPA